MSLPNHQLNLNDGNRESNKDEIKQHEDNLKLLNSQSNILSESILDLQVSLGRYHSATAITSENGNTAVNTEEETVDQILEKENSAAAIFCQLKTDANITDYPFAKDVLGVVATLARVESDDLSRILSEYLDLKTMLSLVCNTHNSVNALEKYNPEGTIDYNGGLHGTGSSIGRKLRGRFGVICLEDLVPFAGGFLASDPQRKLALRKPSLPNGECPAGFVDFAVNLIHLDPKNLSFVTPSGHGLRETLFYALFSRLQVYKSRNEMLEALPCITEGAVSLDGGIINKNGTFVLGFRSDVEVKFPLISGESVLPPDYVEAEELVRKQKWESSKLVAEIQREQQLLDDIKGNFTSQT